MIHCLPFNTQQAGQSFISFMPVRPPGKGLSQLGVIHTPGSQLLGKLRWGDGQFKDSLGNLARLCLRKILKRTGDVALGLTV